MASNVFGEASRLLQSDCRVKLTATDPAEDLLQPAASGLQLALNLQQLDQRLIVGPGGPSYFTDA